MTTSSEVLRLLGQASTFTQDANKNIDNLIVDHDYQQVAGIITKAAVALIESAAHLMRSDSDAGFEALESADDFLDEAYALIDSQIDEDDADE